jgi:hypothetical protein
MHDNENKKKEGKNFEQKYLWEKEWKERENEQKRRRINTHDDEESRVRAKCEKQLTTK